MRDKHGCNTATASAVRRLVCIFVSFCHISIGSLRRLRVAEAGMAMKIFGPKKKEVIIACYGDSLLVLFAKY